MPVTTRLQQSSTSGSSYSGVVYVRRQRTSHVGVVNSSIQNKISQSSRLHENDADETLETQQSSSSSNNCTLANVNRNGVVSDVSALSSGVDKCRTLFSRFRNLFQSSKALAKSDRGALTEHEIAVNDNEYLNSYVAWPHTYILSRESVKVITEEIISEQCDEGMFNRYSSSSSRKWLLCLLPILLLIGSICGLTYSLQNSQIRSDLMKYVHNIGDIWSTHYRKSVNQDFNEYKSSPSLDWEQIGRSTKSLEEKFNSALNHLEARIFRLANSLEDVKERGDQSSAKLNAKYRVELTNLVSQMNSIRDDLLTFKNGMSKTDETLLRQEELLKNHSELISSLPPPCQCTNVSVSTSMVDGIDFSTVDARIKLAFNKYDSDKTGMADYALESSGSTLLSIRCSETYPHKTRVITLLGIPLFYQTYSPRKVIQPGTTPGECWAFKGSVGSVVIKLSGTIRISSVSYEHAPKSILPDGHMDSAPKEFYVYGLMTKNDPEPILLGNYTYVEDGEALQYFPVEQDQNATAVPIVEFKILRNHGHPEYTCLYRFRVHGRRVHPVYGSHSVA